MDITPALHAFDLQLTDGALVARTPIDGSITARLAAHDPAGVTSAIGRAHEAFLVWREVPARGAASWCGCSDRRGAPRGETGAGSGRPDRSRQDRRPSAGRSE